MEEVVAVAALQLLLDLLLLQLGLLPRPLSNPHEVPALQPILQPMPNKLARWLSKVRALGSSDKWPLQPRKLNSYLLLYFSANLVCRFVINTQHHYVTAR